jgi:hypothetical protein
MIRSTLFAYACFAIVGCSGDARSLPLNSIDLSDMRSISTLRNELSASDGAALAEFAVNHFASSTRFCGKPLVNEQGLAPRTVGEAIDLTMNRAAEERLAKLEAKRPRTPQELVGREWNRLTGERDLILVNQSRLTFKHGGSARRLKEWSDLESRLLETNERLSKLKRKIETAR